MTRHNDPDGAIHLIGAILHQAVLDARGVSIGNPSAHAQIQQEAREFLHNDTAITFWCGLTGANFTRAQAALLAAAGLPTATDISNSAP